MKATQHEGPGLHHLVIEPDDYDPNLDYPLVVLLHGFGASMYDLAGLTPAISTDGYLYLCPQGPRPYQITPGHTGYGWTPPREAGTPADAQEAEGLLMGCLHQVMQKYEVAPGRVLLMGFSQGGGLTYQCGLSHPHIFAGLAALSAGLRDPEGLRSRLPDKRGERKQPVFISHGLADQVMPVERGREALEFLEVEGYRPWYREYEGMGHKISPEMMRDLVPWAAEVLPPLVRARV